MKFMLPTQLQKRGAGQAARMATSEVLTHSERGALDNVLRPHLRLEPVKELQDTGRQREIGWLIVLLASVYVTGNVSSPEEKPDGTRSTRRISDGSRIVVKRSRSKSMETSCVS